MMLTVPIAPSKIPYGAFSRFKPPSQIEPSHKLATLSLLPAYGRYLAVCFYPSHVSTTKEGLALRRRLSRLPRAAVRETFPPYPRGPWLRFELCCLDPSSLTTPVGQSRGHAATSRLRLYATPSPCGSASATRETFPTFATLLSLHAADPTPVVHRVLPLCSHDNSRLPRIIS